MESCNAMHVCWLSSRATHLWCNARMLVVESCNAPAVQCTYVGCDAFGFADLCGAVDNLCMMNETPNPIKSGRAAIGLLIIIFSSLVGGVLLWDAVQAGTDKPPPWHVLLMVVPVAIGLWASQDGHTQVGGLSGWWLGRSLVIVWRFVWRYRQGVALGCCVLCAGYALLQIPMLEETDSYRWVTVAWGLSFLFYLWGVVPDWLMRRWGWLVGEGEQRRLILMTVAVGVLACLLRVWRVGELPFTLGGDEASQGLEAIQVIEGVLRNPFGTGWLGVPTMSFFYNSLTIRLFGQTVLGLRFAWVVVGSLTVVVAFLLGCRLKGTVFGLVAALLLATYHYHIHFSRLGSNQIADPFFLTLALFFLYRGLDRRDLVDWALAGGVTGLAFYFYAGARLTPVILVAVLGYLCLHSPRRFWREHYLGVLVMVGAFLVVCGPMIQYAVRFPDDFNARLNMVGIYQSGWLADEVALTGKSQMAVLFDQFQRSFLAFNYYPDRTVWYGLRQPLLDPLFGFLFLVGVLYGTMRLWGRGAEVRLASMVAWWWGGVLLGGMLTESPPSSQRLVTLSVPVCFLLAWMLLELAQVMQRALQGVRIHVVLGVGVVLFAVISLHTYFVVHLPQRIYGGGHAELATVIAPTLRDLAPDHQVYFAGIPRMYWGFATLPYLAPRAEGYDVEGFIEPVEDDLVSRERGAVFVFLPERKGELLAVEKGYPGGEEQRFYSPVDGHLLVVLYIVPPR